MIYPVALAFLIAGVLMTWPRLRDGYRMVRGGGAKAFVGALVVIGAAMGFGFVLYALWRFLTGA